MSSRTTLITSVNVSEGWTSMLDLVLANPGASAGPVILEIGAPGGVVAENVTVRREVDKALVQHGKFSIDLTAFLIFPWRLWNKLGRPGLSALSPIYLRRVYPMLKSRGAKHNNHGTYFQRMIAFSGLSETKRDGRKAVEVNQLERILRIWNKAEARGRHPRHSALQATVFDPAKDHHGAALCGFPCLQQVSFDYHAGFLTINAYYPTQYLFDRGYGNYLGLCHLGQFMAKQMGLQFGGLVCFIGSCQLGSKITKADLVPLQRSIRAHLDASRGSGQELSSATAGGLP